MKNKILILDFGSQYTQLIARRIRELSVYSEIHPFSYPVSQINREELAGVILSGGPASVTEPDSPDVSPEIFELGVPVLGICYGLHLITKKLGGKVRPAHNREYGRATIDVRKHSELFENVHGGSVVWMSHGDTSVELPAGFEVTAQSNDGALAAMEDSARRIYAVQFHPEVAHSEQGREILENFTRKICGAPADWTMENFVETEIASLRERCKDKKVVLGVSGGVDSTTLAVLMYRALGDKFEAVFVNNGLLRQDEDTEVLHSLRERLSLPVNYFDGTDLFLGRLKGVENPEEKRKIIGRTFVDAFFKAAGKFDYLAQGTLYPDVIESAPVKGPSRTIKTHHNRVKEIEALEKEHRIVEPFRFLFKDEVRKVAAILGIPADILGRHPFPGPGLAVRVLGDITREKLDVLKRADKIFIDALKASGEYDNVWQAFAVYLPVKSVGVMGDERAYGNVIALRAVTSVDGMTAGWAKLPYDLLGEVSDRIVRQIREVNRVVYDVSSKPPATIEWE